MDQALVAIVAAAVGGIAATANNLIGVRPRRYVDSRRELGVRVPENVIAELEH